MAYRTPLFIDKLSFTCDVADAEQSAAIEIASELANAGILSRKAQYGDLLKNFRFAFGYILGGRESLVLQMGPRMPFVRIGGREVRRRFMRLEWNPHKARVANPAAPQLIASLLGRVAPSLTMQSILSTMRITRIDLAFDIFGEPIENIGVAGLLRRAYSGHYENSPFGTKNALEIGKKENSRYLRVYDKHAEMLARGEVQRLSQYTEFEGTLRRRLARTRFELQLHKVGELSALLAMNNPFDGFTVRTMRSLSSGLSSHVNTWMLDSCRRRGMHAALSLVENRRERASYLRAITACSPPAWWDPEVIWAEVGAALVPAFSPN